MELSDLVYIDETGYHYADYPAFLEFVTQSYRDIYGADLYLEPETQDGQWLAIQAKWLYDTAALGAAVYSSFSPVTAQGTGLSRVVKINGVNRRSATSSTVDLTLVGVAGTTITDGVAIDTLDQKWDIPSPTVITGGSVVVTATAQEPGAVNAQASTINRIFTPTLGWQTVNNVAAATPGVAVETDAELRVRQAQSTSIPALTVMESTVGGVANLDGVVSVKGYENDTASTDANGIPEHSICLVVYGGDTTEIAEEIALHKTPGTGTFGDTSTIVYDSHGMPLEIDFQRPTLVTIEAIITLAAGIGWSSDYEDLIKEAVAAAIVAGGIGETVLYTKLFTPAYLNGTAAGQTYDIATIEINVSGDPPAAANIALDFDEMPECDPTTDITVVVT